MSKPNFGIVGICAAVSMVIITITLCVICLRVVLGPDGETAAAAGPEAEDTFELDPDVVGKKMPAVNAPRAPKNNKGKAGKTTFIISVDETEFERARLAEKRRVEGILDEADRIIGKGEGDGPGKELKKKPEKLFSFKNLPPEEKNRIWWEIAELAELKQEDAIRYTLTIVKARIIGKRYTTSVLEVFNLFREGADAVWRTDEAPPEPVESGEDESEGKS